MLYVGADPEVFVRDTKTQKFLSAEGLVMGTKQNPWWMGEDDFTQLDGVAAEFNVCPSGSKAQFIGNVARVFKKIDATVKAKNKDLELVAVPVADFDKDYFDKLSPESKELGCNPDMNAYTEDFNPMPEVNVLFRTGSGHVHIGFQDNNPNYQTDNDFFNKCCSIVKQLDFFLGLPSLLWDRDDRRRSLYGKAGAFRPKPYGLEYRVLSNAWVNNPELVAYVYDAVEHAMRLHDRGIFMYDKFSDMAREAIDTNMSDWVTRYGNILERELPKV